MIKTDTYVGYSCFFYIHKIFQTPILLGIPEIEFELESQRVKLDHFAVSQSGVSAEQDDMRYAGCIEISFDNDDHIQAKSEFLIKKLTLVNLGSCAIFNQRHFQVLRIDLAYIEFGTVFWFRATL